MLKEPLSHTLMRKMLRKKKKRIRELDEGMCPRRFACIEVLLYPATQKKASTYKNRLKPVIKPARVVYGRVLVSRVSLSVCFIATLGYANVVDLTTKLVN